jgi:nucleoside 2-deoxyribosyltransferase
MEDYSMTTNNVFIAYSSFPEQIGLTIEESAKTYCGPTHLSFETWKQLDVPGRFIVEGIIERINSCDFFVADITWLNFNVNFEVGYAIGRSKRIVLILNNGLSPQTKDISQLGIYDTLGYQPYENPSVSI